MTASTKTACPCGMPPATKKNQNDNDDVSTSTTPTTLQDDLSNVNSKDLYSLSLIPLNTSFGIVTSKKEDRLNLKNMLQEESRKQGGDVTILFAVRYPGCMGCREHAQQLADYIKSTDQRINLVAAVKDSEANHEALIEFYQFLHKPIYRDEQWRLFKALGGRKLSKFTVMRKMAGFYRRLAGTKFKSGKMGEGDFWTYGGILVFDKKGELSSMHHEEFAEKFDMEAIGAAVEDARNKA